MDYIQLPADGAGKSVLARKIVAAGPGGSDLYVPVELTQQDNGVGEVLNIQEWAAIPGVDTVLSSVPCSIDALVVNNFDVNKQHLYIDDNNGVIIIDEDLYPGFWAIPVSGLKFAGLRWRASANINGGARWYTAS